MTSTCASNSTGSDRQGSMPNAEGAPVQRGMRGVIRLATYEEEGSSIVRAVMEDVDSTGYSDEVLEERIGVGAAQLSRIRSGQAHVPGKLMAWAIENSRHRPARTLVAVCAAGEGEFKPKPPPSVEERHAATLDVLEEMGIGGVVREKVAKLLGVVKP
jgi:hypothetical protein